MKCKSTKFIKLIISPITITDHYPIFFSVGHLLTNRNNTPNPLRISKINHFKLSNLIATQLWDTVLDKTVMSCKANSWEEIFDIINRDLKLKSNGCFKITYSLILRKLVLFFII